MINHLKNKAGYNKKWLGGGRGSNIGGQGQYVTELGQ